MTRPAGLLAAALPLTLLAAAPATLDPDVTKQLAGRVAGPPQDCIDKSFESGPAVYHGALIYGIGRRVYLNRFRGGCPYLQEDDAIKVDVLTGRLCRGDIVTPFVPTTRTVRPTCILGSFEPYDKPNKGGSRGGR